MTKFKYERKKEMDSGSSSGMMPSWKWPPELEMRKKQSFDCYDNTFFLYFVSFLHFLLDLNSPN